MLWESATNIVSSAINTDCNAVDHFPGWIFLGLQTMILFWNSWRISSFPTDLVRGFCLYCLGPPVLDMNSSIRSYWALRFVDSVSARRDLPFSYSCLWILVFLLRYIFSSSLTSYGWVTSWILHALVSLMVLRSMWAFSLSFRAVTNLLFV